MGKRKLDEFLELAKDLSASEIAESLSTLGPVKFRRILSDPKVSTSLPCTHKPSISMGRCYNDWVDPLKCIIAPKNQYYLRTYMHLPGSNT
jgi:hypothetical protein